MDLTHPARWPETGSFWSSQRTRCIGDLWIWSFNKAGIYGCSLYTQVCGCMFPNSTQALSETKTLSSPASLSWNMNDVRKLFERTRIAVTSTEKCTSRRGTMIECNGSEMKRGAAIERLLLLRRHSSAPSWRAVTHSGGHKEISLHTGVWERCDFSTFEAGPRTSGKLNLRGSGI